MIVLVVNCGNSSVKVNGATWAHALDALAPALGLARDALLTAEEIAALDRRRSPEGIIVRPGG